VLFDEKFDNVKDNKHRIMKEEEEELIFCIEFFKKDPTIQGLEHPNHLQVLKVLHYPKSILMLHLPSKDVTL